MALVVSRPAADFAFVLLTEAVSYVVLARKYRPLVFDDMIGQEHIGRTLGNAIRQDRVHHAYLFAGARGLGKTTTARIFAKGLVCEKGPTATPCNACEQCVSVSESRSVDVVEIDGASNNSVDNIRNLREQVHYLPQTARRKVYIIDEVHMLTTSAFNALLKTLEEPPAHVNFIFATTEPQKVIPTILSRVSRLDFRRVSPEETVAHLRTILEKEQRSVDDGGLRLIARAAGGSVRDSLTLLDQVIAFADDPTAITEEETRRVLGQADRARISDLVGAVLSHDPDAVMAQFDELVTAGHDLTVLALQLLEHMRDLTLAALCKSPSVFRGATEAEVRALRDQARQADPTTLSQRFDRFSRVVDRLPSSRVQRMLLEMGLLDLAHDEPLMPLEDIVAKLESMGGGGAGGAAGGGGFTPPPHRGGPSRVTGGPPTRRADAEVPPAAPAPASVDPPPAPAPAPAPAPVPAPIASSGAADHGFGESELMKGLWDLAKTAVSKEPAAPQRPPHEPPRPAAPSGAPPRPSAQQQQQPRPAAGQAVSDDADRCGPCSEAPLNPDAIDLELTPAFEAWEELVSRVREREEFVSAVLSQVGLVSFEGGELKVCAKKGSFPHIELTSSANIRSSLEQAARDHLGRPFTLELIDDEPALERCPSIVLVAAYRKEQRQREVEAEALQHAAIKNLLSTFDATLVGTKPLE